MIQGLVGDVGSGKTLRLTKLGIKLLKEGHKVISNTPIAFTWKHHRFKSITLTNSDDFMKALIHEKNCSILLDEAGVFLPNNFWYKVPQELRYILVQTRHFHKNLYYTVQNFGHSFKILRDLTNWTTICQRRKFPTFEFKLRVKKVFNEKRQTFDFVKYYGIQRPVYFHATVFRPEFFKHSLLKEENIRKFIVNENNIYPSEAKRIFKAYDSWADTRTSAVGDLKLEKEFHVEELLKKTEKETLEETIQRLTDEGNNEEKDEQVIESPQEKFLNSEMYDYT